MNNNIPYELIARYLAGECTEQEKQQVEEWSRQHPAMMDELTKIWQEIPSGHFVPKVEQALQKVNSRIDTKKKSSPRRLYTLIGSIAAIALVLLISTVGFWNRGTSESYHSHILLSLNTSVNQTMEYELPDGSKVWLNQSSEVRYPEEFTENTREIYMEGEVFFDVAPDKDKPFIIYANGTKTQVVGTSFGIKAMKDINEVVVTVSTGIVNLSAKGKSKHIKLTQGEQGICNPEQKKLEKNSQPDPNSLAWKTKVLVFRQSPLTEVADVIENTYHTPISVDQSVADLQITATYEKLSLEELLQVIEMTLQIQAKEDKNGILFERS